MTTAETVDRPDVDPVAGKLPGWLPGDGSKRRLGCLVLVACTAFHVVALAALVAAAVTR